jgi:hypothetical protein
MHCSHRRARKNTATPVTVHAGDHHQPRCSSRQKAGKSQFPIATIRPLVNTLPATPAPSPRHSPMPYRAHGRRRGAVMRERIASLAPVSETVRHALRHFHAALVKEEKIKPRRRRWP